MTLYRRYVELRNRLWPWIASGLVVFVAVATAASEVLGFQDRFQTQILPLLILVFVLDISMALHVSPSLSVARDQSEDNISDIVTQYRPKRADLIAVTAVQANPIIAKLGTQAQIRVLLRHPATAPPQLASRIIANIRFLLVEQRVASSKLDIRCYRQFPSLRGWLLDDSAISVGWYTAIGRADDADDRDMLGHLNPLVRATSATSDGLSLIRMFRRVFDELWDSAEPALDVLKNGELIAPHRPSQPYSPLRG